MFLMDLGNGSSVLFGLYGLFLVYFLSLLRLLQLVTLIINDLIIFCWLLFAY